MAVRWLAYAWIVATDWVERATAIAKILCDDEGCPNGEAPTHRFKVLNHAVKRHSDRARIEKRVVSENVRMLFIAGLEGSGHHLWMPLLKTCQERDPHSESGDPGGDDPPAAEPDGRGRRLPPARTARRRRSQTQFLTESTEKLRPPNATEAALLAKQRVCKQDATLSCALMGRGGKQAKVGIWNTEKLLYNGCGLNRKCTNDTFYYTPPSDELAASIADARKVARETMKELTHKSGGTYLINNAPKTGMMSYPNGNWNNKKIFQYPDVYQFAELGEAAGADTRIVYIRRDAIAMLKSTVEHRGFAAWPLEALLLEHSARVLAGQLASLDPAFVRCVRYEHLPDLPGDLQRHIFGERYADRFNLSRAMVREFRKSPKKAGVRPRIRVGREKIASDLLVKAVKDLDEVAGCG